MKSKYVLELRHRPQLNDDISSRNNRFLERQSGLDSPWRIPNDGSIRPTDIKGELASVVDLNKVYSKDLKGEIIYSFRGSNYLRDAAQYDDYIAIEFNPNNVNYTDLVLKVFPKMVEAFECYRATIYDYSLVITDWQKIIKQVKASGKDVNGRDGIYRINAVNYFDRELCTRSFGLSPEEIVMCLKGKVEMVSLLMNGVLLIYSSSILESDKLITIDSEIKKYLNKK